MCENECISCKNIENEKSIEKNKVYKGDCLDVMKSIDDELDTEDYIHYSFFDDIESETVGKITFNNNNENYKIDTLKTEFKTLLRTFEGGAIRDTNVGKLEYYGFFSPLVMKRFAEYMDKHRKLPDGSLRGSDNWKSLFGENHNKICFDSLLRHLMDVWLIMDNYQDEARDSIEEALCAMSFNINALLLKLLIDKENKSEDINNV